MFSSDNRLSCMITQETRCSFSADRFVRSLLVTIDQLFNMHSTGTEEVDKDNSACSLVSVGNIPLQHSGQSRRKNPRTPRPGGEGGSRMLRGLMLCMKKMF